MKHVLKLFAILTLFVTCGAFTTDNNNHNQELKKMLRESSFEWSRLTPALVVTIPHFRVIKKYNHTKMI